MNLLTQETCPSSDDTRLVPLTQGQFAIVDAADFDMLSKRKWHASQDVKTKRFYVVGYHPFKVGSGNRRADRMHRIILGLDMDDPRKVDHENHNPLDNRRCNLRICTVLENNRNMRKPRTNTSGFKGVHLEAGRWSARIRFNGKKLHLGRFDTPQEAFEAYKQAALRYHGEFACLE